MEQKKQRESMIGERQIKQLMDTPMSRKQFLRYIGVMLLSIFGVGNIISAILHGHRKGSTHTNPLERSGFGGGKYGKN